MGSTPELGSSPGEQKGSSILAWATVHGVAKEADMTEGLVIRKYAYTKPGIILGRKGKRKDV